MSIFCVFIIYILPSQHKCKVMKIVLMSLNMLELQQEHYSTSVNLQQVSESSENVRKCQRKDIVIYGAYVNEEENDSTYSKDIYVHLCIYIYKLMYWLHPTYIHILKSQWCM